MNSWSAMADTGDDLLKSESREILPGVRVYPNPAEVARAAARLFVDYAWQAISRYGRFMVALSGGNTPRAMFQLLASAEFRGQVDWAKVHVFWSDERAVPPDHADSNYGMARRELLLRVPIPQANVHRMEAERANIGRAAHDYEEVLRQLVAKLDARRMTLTLPVLDAALRVVFLVVGAEKAEILRAVLLGKADPPYPAQMVQPRDDGSKLFLVDQAAAALLESATPQTTASPETKAPGASRPNLGRTK